MLIRDPKRRISAHDVLCTASVALKFSGSFVFKENVLSFLKSFGFADCNWAEEEDEEQNIQDNRDGTQQGFPFGANQLTLPPWWLQIWVTQVTRRAWESVNSILWS
ncbi:uncharacterized protein LOC133777478 isoform X1 [Humulus lupulus]|uniref:uncharacterized protein LOC133777478 isoform X1 n=1 Tax=Humulus lupulus TaxID=3486 RepID=UPI002B41182A|nr:uncharacterized protein LOC133777478 isoform X1 [Humulus lupulus]